MIPDSTKQQLARDYVPAIKDFAETAQNLDVGSDLLKLMAGRLLDQVTEFESINKGLSR